MLLRPFAILLTIVGCVEPRAHSEPRCGDGIVTVDAEDPRRSEGCDDGDENGAATSLCTVTCQSARMGWTEFPEDATTLPFPARKFVVMPGFIVSSNFDDNGIALVPIGNSAPEQVLKKYSAPISFEVAPVDDTGSADIIWIERAVPGVGGPWLLWASIKEQTVIQELPYPVPSGTGAIFVKNQNVGPNGIADLTPDGHLHRVWMSNVASPGGQLLDTDLGLAPQGTLFLAAKNSYNNRVVYFFADPNGTVEFVSATDPGGVAMAVREWQGIWPGAIVDAVHGHWTNDLASDQFALLSPDGTVHVSALKTEPGEVFYQFGAVSPRTQRIAPGRSPITGEPPVGRIVGIDQDGHVVVIANNGAGRGLAPQYLTVGPTCTICSIAEDAGTPEWFAFDRQVVHGLFYPEDDLH